MAGKRTLNRLTDKAIKSLTKPGRYADGGNLYIAVRPGGSRQWVFFYRSRGKLTEMSFGADPGVTLARARQLANAARTQVADAVDPLGAKREAERAKREASATVSAVPTFGVYALALVDRIEEGFSNSKHRQQWRNTLQTYCAAIWATPIDAVDTAGVLACLTPIWQTKPETASRLRGRIQRVLNAAKAEGLRSGENPAAWRGHLDATLPKPGKLTRGHHAALAYADMPAFMADLRARPALAALALELGY